jgi:hypothetical protein
MLFKWRQSINSDILTFCQNLKPQFVSSLNPLHIDWGVHIKSVEKKISKGNYLLWRYRKLLNNSSKKVLYESFVRCHLLYGLNVWGEQQKINLQG